MATIRKRSWSTPDGEQHQAWLVDFTDQYGKRRNRQFARKKDADSFLVTARSQVQAGTFTADSESVTIAEVARLWLERCEAEGLEESSLRQYRNHVDYHITPLIGAEKLARLSVPRVEKFRDDLLNGERSRAMAKKALSSLKSLIQEAKRRGLVAQNAARDVTVKTGGRHKKLPESGVDIPTKAEVKALLDAVLPRWRPFVVTATFTGLRASELRGLRWDDVDLDKRLIRVRQRADRWGRIGPPKSATSSRDLPMSPMVVNVLKEWKLASHGAGGSSSAPGRVSPRAMPTSSPGAFIRFRSRPASPTGSRWTATAR